MILVWGSLADPPVAAVTRALAESAKTFLVLDQDESLETETDLQVDAKVHGVLRHGGVEVELESIRGVYLRPHDLSRLQICVQEAERARVAALNETLLAWSEVTPARVVNRPSAMASNNSKPRQSALIHAQGFDVPRTLLTTDPDAVEAFWAHHRQIIYKSMSGVRSIVSRLTPEHRARFSSLSTCPTQFQEWIEGVDIRVHVVGDDVFASRIDSIAVDYRYPQTEAEQPNIEAFDLPSDLVERCWRLMTSLSLEIAGIDLRLTNDGRWFCFEVNPSPGFSYYEQATGQPIARSIARLLARPMC